MFTSRISTNSYQKPFANYEYSSNVFNAAKNIEPNISLLYRKIGRDNSALNIDNFNGEEILSKILLVEEKSIPSWYFSKDLSGNPLLKDVHHQSGNIHTATHGAPLNILTYDDKAKIERAIQVLNKEVEAMLASGSVSPEDYPFLQAEADKIIDLYRINLAASLSDPDNINVSSANFTSEDLQDPLSQIRNLPKKKT